MDIDLAGQTHNKLDHLEEVVRAVCGICVGPDGIEFDQASIDVSRIKEDADYEGVRVRFHASLARARIPMQLDIGFGFLSRQAGTTQVWDLRTAGYTLSNWVGLKLA